MSGNGNLLDRALRDAPGVAEFSDDSLIAAMLRVEVALARAQAELAIIPASAADDIDHCASSLAVDADELVREGAQAGTVVVPLVRALTRAVHARNAEAARHVHFGATSQDLLDTALAICTQRAVVRLEAELASVQGNAVALARRFQSTRALARTLLRPAGVTSLGFRFAQWAVVLARGRTRIWHEAKRGLAVSLGGAFGTLAAFGESGAALRSDLAARLGLCDPGMSWHAWRQDWVALATEVALVVGSLGKIGVDVSLLSQSEVGELSEPGGDGRGVSSAMPHKRNPVLSMRLRAGARAVPGLVSTLLACMPQEQERGLGDWQLEAATWPRVFEWALASTAAASTLLGGLEVHEDRCRDNIDATRGTVFAEPLAHVLAGVLGRPDAQALVSRLCDDVVTSGVPLQEAVRTAIRTDARLQRLDVATVDACFDVEAATAGAGRQVEAMLRQIEHGE